MNPILVIVIAAVVGAGTAVLFNKLVLKNYPEERRKGKYAATIIIFLLVSVSLCGVVIVQSIVTETIKVQSNNLAQFIKNNNPNNPLVRDGISLTKNDDSQINNIVTGIRSLLPSAAELGMNKAIYDIVMDYAMNQLYKKLAIIDSSVAKISSSFIDEDNKITVSSIMGGLQKIVINVVNIICMIIMGIIILLFAIYVIISLVAVRKAKKSASLV